MQQTTVPFARITPTGWPQGWRNALFLAWCLALCSCGGGSFVEAVANAATSVAEAKPVTAPGVQVPMQQSGVHVSVQVTLNGQPARFLVDSGASHNAITESLAQRLGLPRSAGTATGQGAGAQYQTAWVTVAELGVGSATQRDQLAFLVPFPAEFSYDGILGGSFLQAYVSTFDYANGRLLLQSPEAFSPHPDATVLPFAIDKRLVWVQATIAGHTGLCQVDTGAGNAVTVLRPAVDRLGLREAFTPRIRTLTGASAGGEVFGDLVRLPLIEIGPYRLAQVVAELSLETTGFFARSDLLCNLGGAVWERFELSLDYHHRRLYLRPNAQLHQAFEFSRSGMVLTADQGLWLVRDVFAGGPALAAGLVKGDRVLAVNAIPAAQWDKQSLSALSNQAVGTRVLLQVRSETGVVRDVELVLKDML